MTPLLPDHEHRCPGVTFQDLGSNHMLFDCRDCLRRATPSPGPADMMTPPMAAIIHNLAGSFVADSSLLICPLRIAPMTDHHRATPKQHPWAANPDDWRRLYENAHQGMEDSSCILELRARVEALEKAQRPFAVIDTSQWSEEERQRASGFRSDPAKWQRLMYEQADPAPADALVERVMNRLSPVDGRSAARAAIREVAAWLRENPGPNSAWLAVARDLIDEASK